LGGGGGVVSRGRFERGGVANRLWKSLSEFSLSADSGLDGTGATGKADDLVRLFVLRGGAIPVAFSRRAGVLGRPGVDDEDGAAAMRRVLFRTPEWTVPSGRGMGAGAGDSRFTERICWSLRQVCINPAVVMETIPRLISSSGGEWYGDGAVAERVERRSGVWTTVCDGGAPMSHGRALGRSIVARLCARVVGVVQRTCGFCEGSDFSTRSLKKRVEVVGGERSRGRRVRWQSDADAIDGARRDWLRRKASEGSGGDKWRAAS
jgi:hypothetical protein